MRPRRWLLLLPALPLLLTACSDDAGRADAADVRDAAVADAAPASDAGARADAATDVVGSLDGATVPDARDAVAADASAGDALAGDAAFDGAAGDAATDALRDAAMDASADSATDAATDARPDSASDARTDAPADARADVAVPPDAATGGCVSGATGTHVVRFGWTGSGSGSTASVRYEANTLPDTSRWRVTANSMSIGYRPVYDDTFLGPGGLDLEGTGFMDVELSTARLPPVRAVTIAVFGRSFNTTASGSYSWRTFSGAGAAPTNLVANSAPYRWYLADATAAFVAGDPGVLLRIYPGPSSNAVIVNRVEVCLDAR